MEERRLNNQSGLHSLLDDLLKQHKESKLKEIQSLPDGELSEQSILINEKYIEQVTELKQIFQDADSTKKERDVPDYLCGKISFELMKDPCITPSGITYPILTG
jgi:STIP1 family protein 1